MLDRPGKLRHHPSIADPRRPKCGQLAGGARILIVFRPRWRSARLMSDDARESRPPAEASQRTTLKHIAEHAGVSRATVSLVLRESPLVPASTPQPLNAPITP